MNKNIKKVIAVALTLSAFAAISPATEYNLFAYEPKTVLGAATYDVKLIKG